MEIEFTKEEYRKLFDLIFLGELVASASYGESDTKKRKFPYKDICQKIYSKAKEVGYGKLADLDNESNEYWPSRYYEDNSAALKMFHKCGEDALWQGLVMKLAERDVCKKIGEKERFKLQPLKYIEVSHPFYEKYQNEFNKHGAKRLVVDEGK